MEELCYVCFGAATQLCCVCERLICDQHKVAGLLGGDIVICIGCDKITPNREQAGQHYLLRFNLRKEKRKRSC